MLKIIWGIFMPQMLPYIDLPYHGIHASLWETNAAAHPFTSLERKWGAKSNLATNETRIWFFDKHKEFGLPKCEGAKDSHCDWSSSHQTSRNML